MSEDFARDSVSVGGVQTEVLSGGQGPLLLFLHSSWGPDVFSDAYLRALAKSYRVIAPYHPGYGRNDRPKHFASIGDVAYFYLDYLQQEGLRDVNVVGASIGGWIASEIAVRSTQRISKLVLVDPFGIKAGGRENRDFADFFAVGEAERRRLEFEKTEFQVVDYANKSDDQLTIIARGREAEVHYGWNPFMHNPQLKHWLHRIDVPTLVLRGSNDQLVSYANHVAYCELVPRASLELIENSGHHPHLDRPAAFADRVDEFLAGSRSAPASKLAS
jgi:pimeloyl-ACP methyl ester carboxylesterase